MSTSTENKSLTRNQLYDLIWSEPITKVAPRFGLSDVGLAKVCKRYDIPRPPVGYWAKKEFGKQPPQTPLPPSSKDINELIEFVDVGEVKPAKALTAEDLVTDDDLKALIRFEAQPENRVVVKTDPSRYHTYVQQTRAWLDARASHNWANFRVTAHLDVEVSKASQRRALRIMDALLKAIERRGHKLVEDRKDYRTDVLVLCQGEKFAFRLREKNKMIRIPEAERKDSWSNRVRYEPSGVLELRLMTKRYGGDVSWKDSQRTQLEDVLNEVLIRVAVAVQTERNHRREEIENERRRQEEYLRRQREEEARRREQQRIDELHQMVTRWDQATQIRAFLAELRSAIELRNGDIDEGSELAKWIDWGLRHANAIDPLAQTPESAPNWKRPNQPR